MNKQSRGPATKLPDDSIANGMDGGAAPMSQSALWALQRAFFENAGVRAWSENIVPSYITTNTFIAHSYAELVVGYLSDMAGTVSPGCDTTVYIVELGAGAGRFAYHFLTDFFPTYEHTGLPFHVVYVMTDLARSNLDYWQNNTQLRPFVESGHLDFAFFDVCSSEDIDLLVSDRRLSPESPAPMAVIANYVFDSIPADAFLVRDGRLYEALVKLAVEQIENEEPREEDPGPAPEDSNSQEETDNSLTGGKDTRGLADLSLNYELHPCSTDYYLRQGWNGILNSYTDLKTEGAFLFPSGALSCVDRLRVLSAGELMLVSGDKGSHRVETVLRPELPSMVKHGSVSFSVNYHALSEYTRLEGGSVFEVPRDPHSLDVIAFRFSGKTGSAKHLSRVFHECVESFGPDDWYVLKKAADRDHVSYNLAQYMALVRMSRYDSRLVSLYYDHLIETAQQQQNEWPALIALLDRVESGYYWTGPGEDDLSFQLGNLYAALRAYEKALRCFETSMQRYGADESTIENMRLCERLMKTGSDL